MSAPARSACTADSAGGVERGDRGVGQVVGQRHAAEVQALAQQVRHHGVGERRRRDEVVVGVEAVGDNDPRRALLDGGAEGHQVLGRQLGGRLTHVGGSLLHGLGARPEAREVAGRREHVCVPVGRHRCLAVAGDLSRVGGEGARSHGGVLGLAHVQGGGQHAVHPQAVQRARSGRRLAAPGGGAGEVGRGGGRRQAGQRVEPAALLARHHPRAHAVPTGRRGAQPRGQSAQRPGPPVVGALQHHAPDVAGAEGACGPGAGVAAGEAEQEDLRHLAGQRHPRKLLGGGVRHARLDPPGRGHGPGGHAGRALAAPDEHAQRGAEHQHQGQREDRPQALGEEGCEPGAHGGGR